MPLYDYQCPVHGIVEVFHKMNESPDLRCESEFCTERLKRIFNPAPIVFKGSGFYVNDARGKPKTIDVKPKGNGSEAVSKTSEIDKA